MGLLEMFDMSIGISISHLFTKHEVFITGRNEVVAKVIFLQVSVCLGGGRVSASAHAGMPYPPGWRNPPLHGEPPLDGGTPPDGDPPPGKQTPAYGLRAAGTHPSGMHSCLQKCS